MKLITTSWDDGHPTDIILAELLEKYSLKGTFYIPRFNTEREVMNEGKIRRISENFEIGGHTLNHKNLKWLNQEDITIEVAGCFDLLKKILGSDPVSFCPPYGEYSNETISIIKEVGFKIIRTTELLSPFSIQSSIVPTTLQVFEHSRFTFFRHLLKRGKIVSLGLWAKGGFTDDIFRLLDYYLNYIDLKGGCLHIWGHSWEIIEYGLWDKMEAIFKFISNHKDFQYVENRDLIAAHILK